MLLRFFSIVALFFVSNVFSQTPLIPFRDGKAWGFCDTLGKVIVKPYLDTIHDVRYDGFFKKAAFVVRKGNNKFVVNENNQLVVPVLNKYDSIKLKPFDVRYVEVYKKGKLGIVRELVEKVPCLYDEVVVAANASYYVYLDQKCGLLNEKKKLVIPIQFDEIYPIGEEMINRKTLFAWEAIKNDKVQKFFDNVKIEDGQDMVVGLKEMVGSTYFSENGIKEIQSMLSKQYAFVEINEYEGIAIVGQTKDKLGVYSLAKKELLIEPKYEFVALEGEDAAALLFKVKLNSKWGILKENNQVYLPIKYDSVVFDSSLNLFLIEQERKIGFKIKNTIYPTVEPKYLKVIDKQNFQVNDAWNFSLIQVQTSKGYGFVGENGIEYFKD